MILKSAFAAVVVFTAIALFASVAFADGYGDDSDGEVRRLTLITGETVEVSVWQDGTTEYTAAEAAVTAAALRGVMDQDGYYVPAARPGIHKLDRELFNVGYLLEHDYDKRPGLPVIVAGEDTTKLASLATQMRSLGANVTFEYMTLPFLAVELPAEDMSDLTQALLDSPDAKKVWLDRKVRALGRDGAADGRTAPAGLRHPPLRTGRATFTASGSPSDGLDRCVGNIGFSAILVGFIHPASGVVRFVPLPSDCPPSPCGRLSRPRTTTRALPHVRRWPKAGLLRCRRAGRASQVRPGCIFMPS